MSIPCFRNFKLNSDPRLKITNIIELSNFKSIFIVPPLGPAGNGKPRVWHTRVRQQRRQRQDSSDPAVSRFIGELVVVDLDDAERPLDVFRCKLRLEVACGQQSLAKGTEEPLLAVIPGWQLSSQYILPIKIPKMPPKWPQNDPQNDPQNGPKMASKNYLESKVSIALPPSMMSLSSA